MKSIILYSVFAVATFSVAAGGSYVYFNSTNSLEIPANEQAEAEVEPVKTEVEPPAESLPTIAVETSSMSAAEIFRFGATIKARQEALTAREKAISQREMRLNLVQNDITGQQREIDGMIEQNRDLVTQTEKLLAVLAAEQQKLNTQKSEVDAKLTELSTKSGEPAASPQNLAANLKVGADWVQNLKPEPAAEMLEGMINNGDMKSVVQTLRGIESRKVAGILAAMDKEIRVEVLNSLKESEPLAPKTASKR